MTEPDIGLMIESAIDDMPQGGKSMVVYWHPDCFLDEPLYRRIVRWMIDVWRERLDIAVVDEPKEESYEDFVVHRLSVSGRRLNIYWENSLGYIALQSEDIPLLREMAVILKGKRPPL